MWSWAYYFPSLQLSFIIIPWKGWPHWLLRFFSRCSICNHIKTLHLYGTPTSFWRLLFSMPLLQHTFQPIYFCSYAVSPWWNFSLSETCLVSYSVCHPESNTMPSLGTFCENTTQLPSCTWLPVDRVVHVQWIAPKPENLCQIHTSSTHKFSESDHSCTPSLTPLWYIQFPLITSFSPSSFIFIPEKQHLGFRVTRRSQLHWLLLHCAKLG